MGQVSGLSDFVEDVESWEPDVEVVGSQVGDPSLDVPSWLRRRELV